MANNCALDMRIAGREDAVLEMVKMLRWEDPYQECGIGRVYSFDLDPSLTEQDPSCSGLICVQGFGDCAWSFKTAILDWGNNAFLDACFRLGLVVEAFTSEPGIGFQEHILIDRGKIITDECVDYEEHLIDGAEAWYIEQVCEDHGLTREELMSKVNHNGEYTIGGFENYCDFDDLFTYLEPERKTLNQQIFSAAKRAESQTTSTHNFTQEKERG